MSEHSYQESRRLGVTGRNTHTCHIAAIDRLAEGDISPATYMAYEEFVVSNGNSRTLHRVYNDVAEDLHIGTIDDIIALQLRSKKSFYRTVHELLAARYIVVVDIQPYPDGQDINHIHSIGLQPVSARQMAAKSTWLPDDLRQPVSLARIYSHLHHPHNSSSYMATNLLALPRD